ncbi:MAG: hypothetical protein Q4F83_14965, partial [Eubacteriales bacterium]|nr:hypothetical protein [Eubacteriales bacterium]
ESEETTESEKITKPDNQNKSANSKSSDKKDASDTGSSANAPKTGDTTDIVLWLCLMALAGVGVIFVFAVKRSRKSR